MAPTLKPDERPLSDRWEKSGASIEEIATGLNRLHSAHIETERHTMARTTNLVVGPGTRLEDEFIRDHIANLGIQGPSRTVILREHAEERLRAEVTFACDYEAGSHEVTSCHDTVTVWADRARLRHAASLAAPLLARGLPIFAWLPGDSLGPAGESLLELGEWIVVDSSRGDARCAISRAKFALQFGRVNDIAWVLQNYWRTRVASAFSVPENLDMLGKMDAVAVGYRGGSAAPALLLCGWIAARAGWDIASFDCADGGEWRGGAARDSETVDLTCHENPRAAGVAGVDSVEFFAAERSVKLTRGAARFRHREFVSEALYPITDYTLGYDVAVEALFPVVSPGCTVARLSQPAAGPQR